MEPFKQFCLQVILKYPPNIDRIRNEDGTINQSLFTQIIDTLHELGYHIFTNEDLVHLLMFYFLFKAIPIDTNININNNNIDEILQTLPPEIINNAIQFFDQD